MTFGTPAYLLLLLAVPLALALIAWWLAWRSAARRRFAVSAADSLRPVIAPALLIVAVALAAVAAAHPQFGSRDRQVEQRGIDLVIVLDISNSMLAGDVQPSRLARSQAEIDALIDRLTGDRVGLVVFARKPFVRAPLTSDLSALRTIVDGVDRERALVEPGSDLGAAIRAGQTVLARGTADTEAMLIVSDGEDHGAAIAPAIDDLRAAHIRVYTAGAGTAAGAPVRDVDRSTGASRIRLDASGAPVVTHLDAAALQRIAAAAAGRYIALDGSGPSLTSIVPELQSFTRTTFGSKSSSQPIDRFQIFATLALLLVAAEIVAPILRRPTYAWRAATRLWPLGAAGLLVGAICSTTVADINRRGNGEYARNQYDAALGDYRTAEALSPSLAELNYNVGNAFDRQGDFARAIDETRRGQSDRAGITAKLAYALGNHYIGAGRVPDAIEAYKRALLADPSDVDAKRNLELASARLAPTAMPTSAPPERPTPQAGDRTPGADNTPGSGAAGSTPAATSAAAGAQSGTPQAGDRQLTREQLQHALDEALAGIDGQFSKDDALRILDLLDQRNRRAFEDAAPAGNSSTIPDY